MAVRDLEHGVSLEGSTTARALWVPVGMLVLVLVALVVMVSYALWASRQQAVALTQLSTRNLVEVLESRISGDFARLDGILGIVVNEMTEIELGNEPGFVEQVEHNQRIAALADSFPLLAAIIVFDGEGLLRFASNERFTMVDVHDRPHFRYLKQNPDAQAVFSEAQVSRATGQWSIVRMLAIRDDDRDLLGAVAAVIHLEEFADLFAGVDTGEGGVVLLRRSDDFRLIQRYPRLREADFNDVLPPDNAIRVRITAGEREGSLTYVASTDDEARIASFKAMADYPFYVQVAVTVRESLHAWQRQASLTGGLALLLLFASAWGLVWIYRAESRTRKTTARLSDLANRLKASNAELEQFAYVASHDLRQPLRMVRSYVQMLERRLDDKLDADTRQMMHFAADGAARLDQMLVSLLEYSRVGRKGEPMALLDSRAALDEALRFLAPAIREAAAQVKVSGDWPTLLVSRDEFTRLLQNLIDNALKYRAAERPVEVLVTVEPADRGWVFSVSDNGIGIDPAQFDRLFKVFQRLQTREKFEGSGIGLAVARKIVERHGGRIWVESPGLDHGSRFCFFLPAGRVETEQKA